MFWKSSGNRPLERPRLRWEYCLRMEIKEIGINARSFVDSAQDRDYWKALVIALNLPGFISHGGSITIKFY
jgi:hypothetical protein